MDLTRLYNLTTPELREEAERLGVDDTYAMSRGQLIHAIRARGSQSETFLGKVVGFAKWALQAAGETASASEMVSAPAPKTAAASETAPVPETAPESETAPVAETAPESETAPVAETAPESASGGPQSRAETGAAPSSRPPAGVFSTSGGLFEEPIPTRTMARILAEQGHYKRSLAIYARLLVDEPDDGELSAEADAVRAQARARRSHAPP